MTERTSRVGRRPVHIPTGVDVKLNQDALTVKGPKGQLTLALNQFVKIAVDKSQFLITADNSAGSKITGLQKKTYKSIVGTVRSEVANLVKGVTEGFERKLNLVGVGYRAQAKDKILSLSLGFSHPTDFTLPEGITVETPTPTEIIIKGANKQLVGETAAKIRSMRSPEPYKGKGAKYSDEIVKIKETKKK